MKTILDKVKLPYHHIPESQLIPVDFEVTTTLCVSEVSTKQSVSRIELSCCCYKVKEGAAIYLGIVREIGTVVPPKFSCTNSHFCCFGTRFPLGQTCGSFASSFGIESDCRPQQQYYDERCFLFGNVGLVFHEVVKFHENHLCVQRDTEIYCPTAAAVKKNWFTTSTADTE